MTLQRISSIRTTDFSSQNTEFSVSSKSLNSANRIGQTTYRPDFKKWNGYYEAIPEAKTIIDTLERWIFGRGFKGDKKELDKLKKFVGNGKESARKIIRNAWRCSKICGDGFAEIVRDNQGRPTNLKPLSPEAVTIVYNEKGMLERYDLESPNGKTPFEINDILHFSNNRTGDGMNGLSLFQALETIILNRNECIDDLKILFHRFVKPINIYEADTDDDTELAKLEAKLNLAFKKSENMLVPSGTFKKMKNEIISTQTGNLSPIEYYKTLVRIFITSCGVPEIIMGWSEGSTEASSKIVYLAWEQTIEDEQLNIEEDLELQLNIKINLEFPASIEEQLLKDKKKDGPINGPEKQSELKPTNPQIKK
jgi:hypothetical protein